MVEPKRIPSIEHFGQVVESVLVNLQLSAVQANAQAI